ncbi:MAG: hypothetical protein LBK82_16625 [Planctomycetaceae bacterium]|nr:hypothetical protein [Planctomycetaceae bacterium]
MDKTQEIANLLPNDRVGISRHPIRPERAVVTRRVAAGWLVLPFQGGVKTYYPFNENSTEILPNFC